MTHRPIKEEEGLSGDAVIFADAVIPAQAPTFAPFASTTAQTPAFDPSYFGSSHAPFNLSRLARLAEPETRRKCRPHRLQTSELRTHANAAVDLNTPSPARQANTVGFSTTPNAPTREDARADLLDKGCFASVPRFEHRLSEIRHNLAKNRETLDQLIAPVEARRQLEKTLAHILTLRYEEASVKKKLRAKRKALEDMVDNHQKKMALKRKRPARVGNLRKRAGSSNPGKILQVIKTEPREVYRDLEPGEIFEDMDTGQVFEYVTAGIGPAPVIKTAGSASTSSTRTSPIIKTEPGSAPTIRVEPVGKSGIAVNVPEESLKLIRTELCRNSAPAIKVEPAVNSGMELNVAEEYLELIKTEMDRMFPATD